MDVLLTIHRDSWAVLIVLFLVSYFLLKTGKGKAGKIVHMIVRLFYLIMIITGIGSLIAYNFAAMYIVKGILAIALIYVIEMILVRTAKGTLGGKAATYWLAFIILLVIVVLMGFGVIRF
ncbi:DUF1516 family protein [Halalkalibacterium ligniniphilum]|uniref:DUF1516 family protein n=1 Tax=Halalkalibacterium ligniniphilum TaxID=1134413 RepID=UPI00034D280D|nr:DUF1516 family protein [Halalkalibacterium ligniniphilum]